MRTRRIFPPLFCLIFMLTLLIGSGYAYFFFGPDKTESHDQNVTVDIADNIELGNVRLVSGDADVDISNFKYNVFLSTDSVYIIREDNPTLEAGFFVECEFKEGLVVPDGYTVGLACYITVSDPDERGVNSTSYNGKTYPKSASLVDYIKPLASEYETDRSTTVSLGTFDMISGDDNSTEVKYRCIIRKNIYSGGIGTSTGTGSAGYYTTDEFKLIFVYSDYEMKEGTHTFSGSMMPTSQLQANEDMDRRKECEQIMSWIKEAEKNANVNISFGLVLLKGD